MTRQLIATKVHPPRPARGVVPRPGLVAAAHRGAESALLLVSAPAGFGKTTLLAALLGEVSGPGRRVAWLSLDASNRAPGSFWTYVIGALQVVLPEVGSGALELIRSAGRPSDEALTDLLNDLSATPGETWLVLDDYHLADHQDVARGLAFVLEHLPSHVHLVVSTRADPDLPLARWRANGRLAEIRAADLRFTPEEAATYLHEATGMRLAAEDVDVLESRTEGWIAALQLAALSLRGRTDVRGFIAGFAGTDRYIVDYLVEEVLAHQSAPVRDFLLRSSVLDRLTGPLCDVVVGGDDSSRLLASLERANLFVVPLDDHREWYRYHQLFADVLRARLAQAEPRLVPVLHERASRWFEEHDLADDAVGHALAGGAVDRAARLMELAAPAIRRDRRDDTMFGWLAILPDEVIRRSPVLTVFSGYMRMVAGDIVAGEARLDDAEALLAAAPEGRQAPWSPSEELRTLPATIAVYRASLAQARGDLTGTARHAGRALDLAGPGDHLSRGSAEGFLGLAAWSAGDLGDAVESFSRAVASLHAGGLVVDALASTVALGEMLVAHGRATSARALYEEALVVAEARGEGLLRAAHDLHLGLAALDCEAGEVDAATRRLISAAALGIAAPAESRCRALVVSARLAEATGDPGGAVHQLDDAEVLHVAGFFPDVRPIPAQRARVWIRAGRLDRAAAWARDRGLTVDDNLSYLREFEHLTLVRLLIAQNRATGRPETGGQALRLLERLRAAAAGRVGSRAEIEMLSAVAAAASGDRRRGRESLDRALTELPEPEGYVRLFLDEGPPMLDLLGGVVTLGAGRDLALRLLDHGARPSGRPSSGDSHAAVLVERLSERELQVLGLLDTDLTGPQLARELYVTLNTLRSHTKHIFTKLGVTTRRGAVQRGRELGLL